MNRLVVAYMGIMVIVVSFLPKGHEQDNVLARWVFIALTVTFVVGVIEGRAWAKGGWK